ncbi:MAG TPA: NTP transferase domain-containing protein [Candidatus Angelobacter sp.]|jgi:CTP:molybdopterin cytidylyltransferase MocA|nr:NTP transferase domain-containing protein [Candidatus Angelobacter sp.]
MDTNKKAAAAPVAAIVLAAGSSRRMGQPKQLLMLNGKTLLEHTLGNVREAGIGEIVLVLGANAEEIGSRILTDGLKVVVNAGHEAGMGTSLRTGLAAVSPEMEAALIVLADQPFVRPRTLRAIVESRRRTGAQITIPLYNGFRGNPVLLGRSVFPEVMGLSGDVGCRAIFGTHVEGIHKLPVNDIGVLIDIDAPDDVRHLRLLAPEDDADAAAVQLPELEIEPREPGENAESHRELVIIGNDEVAVALAELARVLGMQVTVVDPLLGLEDFYYADAVLHKLNFSLLGSKEKCVLVASRGRCDEEALAEALRTDARYIGLLANKKRSAEVLTALKYQGFSEGQLKQIHAPAGIEIGAKSPEEIALSIAAEMVKVTSSRTDG